MNRLQQLVEMQDEALAVSSTHSDDYTPANTLTNEEKQLQSAEEASGRSANVRTPHVDFADLARDREDARLDAEAERKGKEPAIVRPDTGMQSDESSVSPVPRDVSASGDSDYSAGEMADRSSPVVANGSTSPTADHQNNTPHAQSMGVEQDTTKPNSRELPNIRVDLISGDDISLDALSEGVTRLPSSVPGAGTNQSASNSKSKGARTNQKAPNTNRGKHIRARSTTGGFTDSLPSLSEGRRRGRANSYSPVQQLSVSLALTAATPNDEPEERKKAKTSSDALPSSADAIKSRLGTGGNLKIDTSFRKRSQSYGSNMNALAGGNGGVSTQDEGNQVQHTNSMSPLYNSAKKFDNRRASSVSGTLNHNDKSLNNTFSFSNDHRASMSQSQPGNTNSSTSTTLQRQDSLEKFLSVKRLSQIGSQYGFAASRSPSPPLSSDANKLGGTKSQPSIYRNRAPVSESPTSTRNRSGNMLRATRIYSSQDALQTFSTNSSNARSRARSTTASFMGSASIPTNIASDGVSSHATNESASSSEGKGLERSSSTDYDSDRHYGSAISAISDADRRLQSDTNPETASPTEIKVNSLVDSQASQEHNASDPTSETALPGSPTSSDAPQVCSGVDADVRPREDRTVLGSSSTNSTNSTANQANRSSIRQNMRLPPKLSIVPPSDPLIVADEDG
ncbi:hypothetical protein SARC_07717 [Sphaeroforma arctica JP610]|uniref:Uncharacterized protein n=1 Tax=Sphaeroforma arctica JP610 TaxID=667725 RepID=A0A0L0FSW0_9EUKA|nr:hypothetical protein SARC_07717 [Sphaeroforma arctica JP610]KNC79897.1 hypothetical protein SARC_07717 [Sphaeroforma arctica JP610]|eukprot:XP_014153799.1 hypothetical protein SARC_07717 [Sphaeroforma arctica JP610]